MPEGDNNGRHISVRTDWQEKFLEAYSENGNLALTCRMVGVGRETVRREREREESFAEAYKEAQANAAEIGDAELRRRGLTGTPTTKTTRRIDKDGTVIEEVITQSMYISTAGLIAYLRAHHPAYKESWRIEHTGDGGGPVQIQVERDRSPERLEQLLQIAAEMGWEPAPKELPPGTTNGA